MKRGSRGIGNILGNSNVSLLLLGESIPLMRLLDLRSHHNNTPPYRFLTNSNHGRKTNVGRIGTCMCVRMDVIAKGKMSLSSVAVS